MHRLDVSLRPPTHRMSSSMPSACSQTSAHSSCMASLFRSRLSFQRLSMEFSLRLVENDIIPPVVNRELR